MTGPSSDDRGVASVLEAGRTASSARRRRTALLGAAGGLVVVASWWLLGRGDDAGIEWVTQPASRAALVVTVDATGTLQPTNQVDVGSELSGIVATVEADFNDRVSRGQLLARLDTTRLEAEALQSRAQLAMAEASLVEARASFDEAESEMARMAGLRRSTGGRLPSAQEYEAAEAALGRARGALAAAEARIEAARGKVEYDATNLAKAEIRAPIDGIVLTREVEAGQTIAASLQAPKLFRIAEDLAKMELEVDVDEADVGQVREGQDATFTVDSYPGRSFPARIRQVRFAPETVGGVVTYKAVLDVDNRDLSLRPGMTATAAIVVASLDSALLVPNEALRFVPPVRSDDDRSLLQRLMPFTRRWSEPVASPPRGDNRRTVHRLDDGEPRAVEIHVGLSDGSRTEVTEGEVAEGDLLVVDAIGGKEP